MRAHEYWGVVPVGQPVADQVARPVEDTAPLVVGAVVIGFEKSQRRSAVAGPVSPLKPRQAATVIQS